MKGFMMPRRFWRTIGIGPEKLLFHIGSIGLYRIGYVGDAFTIAINKIRKFDYYTPEEDLPF